MKVDLPYSVVDAIIVSELKGHIKALRRYANKMAKYAHKDESVADEVVEIVDLIKALTRTQKYFSSLEPKD